MSQPPIVSPVQEVVEFFAQGPSREQIADFRLSDEAQQRLRDLIHKNSAGELVSAEHYELDRMLLLNDIVSLIRARIQRQSAPGNGYAPPTELT